MTSTVYPAARKPATTASTAAAKVFTTLPSRQQVNTFARAFENAVHLDRVPIGEREAVAAGDPETDLREPQMTRIHGSAGEPLRRCYQFREASLP
jgi:hypothetical protein